MKKLVLMTLTIASVAVLSLASAPESADAAKPCLRTDFKTALVKDACAKGGQAEAKKQMKKFLSKAKKKEAGLNCKSCHTDLKKYELKPDALEKYKQLGGK